MPVLNQTLAPQQAPAWIDPYEAQRAALQARMQQQAAPMYSEEEAQQRVAQNQREYQLGLLAQLSGDQDLGAVGGTVLKRALANRQPVVSERGTADPLTGKFTYSPDYIRAQQQAQLDKLDASSAASRERFDRDERERAGRLEQMRERMALMAAIRGASGADAFGAGGSQIGVDDAGGMVFRDKRGNLFRYDENGNAVRYAGKISPKQSNAQPTEGERKAATLLKRLEFSESQLKDAVADSADAAKPSVGPELLRHTPFIGEWVANSATSPERQRVEAAQLDLLDAALTLGTGASYTREQLLGYTKSYFPQINDDAKTIKDKQARLANVIESARIAAGRAAPQAGTTPKAPSAPKAPAGGGGALSPEEAAELAALQQRFGKGAGK